MVKPKKGRPAGGRPTRLSGFRLDVDLLARLDRHVKRLAAASTWARPTRSDALRDLLLRALEQAEAGERRTAR